MFKHHALSIILVELILLELILVLALGVWSSLKWRTMDRTIIPDYPGLCVPAKMAGPWQEGRLSIDLAHHQMVYEQADPSGGSGGWGKPLC